MMNFSLVDVKSITSDVPRSNFPEADLDNLADIILKAEGIIRPLVVKTTGIESFSVVDGHFEYYAAVRAKEKDARKGEMVNAFVISPKLEDLVVKQATILRGKESSEKPVKTTADTTNLESRVQNLELRLEKQLNELKSEITQERKIAEDKIKQLEKQIPQPSHPLTLINTLDKEQLLIKLQRSRISGAEKLSEGIINAREKKSDREFTDYRDVVNSVKGLGDKTILTVIDEWSK